MLAVGLNDHVSDEKLGHIYSGCGCLIHVIIPRKSAAEATIASDNYVLRAARLKSVGDLYNFLRKSQYMVRIDSLISFHLFIFVKGQKANRHGFGFV